MVEIRIVVNSVVGVTEAGEGEKAKTQSGPPRWKHGVRIQESTTRTESWTFRDLGPGEAVLLDLVDSARQGLDKPSSECLRRWAYTLLDSLPARAELRVREVRGGSKLARFVVDAAAFARRLESRNRAPAPGRASKL